MIAKIFVSASEVLMPTLIYIMKLGAKIFVIILRAAISNAESENN